MTKLHIAPKGAKRSQDSINRERQAVAEMIDREMGSDVSGLVKDTMGSKIQSWELYHTDITIREMRACVADAGYRNWETYDRKWHWIDNDLPVGVVNEWNIWPNEQASLQHCIRVNNLGAARFTREPQQWLAVSDWLRDALREHGETVREFAGLNIWLRCTEGELVGDIALRSVWETAG